MNKFYKKILGMVLSLLFLMPLPIMANEKNLQEVNIDSLQKSNVEDSQEIKSTDIETSNVNQENVQDPNVLYQKGVESGSIDSSNVNQENVQDPNVLYQKGVESGSIDSSEVSQENWQDQEKDLRENYNTAIAQGILKDISYNKWLELNNYGQFPKMNSELFDEIVIKPSSRRQKRSTSNNIPILSGDILITNSTSSYGVAGHAAIANGNGYVLDMPGYGDLNDNNRQSSASNWLSYYKKGWIKIYRLKNRDLARQVGRYADRHYYSTNGSATKNIHIPYRLSPHLYDMSTAYCSKLVYCAYWYGTGSLPVMKRTSGYVTPRGLVDCFTSAYMPSRIS